MFLQVERHGLICVSVNNKMLLLVIITYCHLLYHLYDLKVISHYEQTL